MNTKKTCEYAVILHPTSLTAGHEVYPTLLLSPLSVYMCTGGFKYAEC